MHAVLHAVPPTLQHATTDAGLCWRLLKTHRQVWVSLLWGHCSFLLGHGAYKVLFVLSQSLFPQSCVSSGGSMVGLIMTSSKRAYATRCVTQVCCTQNPYPCGRPLLTCASVGDTQTLKGRSGSVSLGSLGPSAHKVLFLQKLEHLQFTTI